MTAQILVVDDEPDLELLIQQKFRHQIREGAVTFLFARDGVDALAQLQSNGSIDMVVTDINMPRMDGLSLLQKLQETEDKPSTIIVSAYGDMANIRTAMNRGAFDFLTKPIDLPISKRPSPRRSGTSKPSARRASGRRRPNVRMRRSRATSHPIWRSASPAMPRPSICADSGARSQRCSATLRASPPWSSRSNPTCSARYSTTILSA